MLPGSSLLIRKSGGLRAVWVAVVKELLVEERYCDGVRNKERQRLFLHPPFTNRPGL